MPTAPKVRRFAHECKSRRARHAEIARRYAWQARQIDPRIYPRGSPALIRRVRLRDLEALYGARYGGGALPYDDAGLDDLKIAANHIAHLGGDAFGHIVAWASAWMPHLPRQRAEALARDVLDDPRRYKAATLGWRLHLTEEERAALSITTIRPFGATDADMKERRKAKARARAARWRQRQRDSKPAKPPPLAATRPWEPLGMGRRTWYRKGNLGSEAARKRGTKPRTQQGEDSCCARVFVPRARPAAQQGAIRRNKNTQARPNAVAERREGFRVMPWYPAHIHEQAKGGWWGIEVTGRRLLEGRPHEPQQHPATVTAHALAAGPPAAATSRTTSSASKSAARKPSGRSRNGHASCKRWRTRRPKRSEPSGGRSRKKSARPN